MPSITKSILLVSLISLIWAHTDPYHTCIHDQLDFEPQYIDVPIAETPQDGRSLQDGYSNIRIFYDYTGGAFSTISADFQNYIKNTILPPVENIFEATLRVKPVVGNLSTKLTTMCSGAVTVPAIYNNGGVAADLVLFVDVVNDSTQAYAAFGLACVMSSTTKRPLFGRIVYNMAKVSANTNSITIEKDLSITLHESTHALGFTAGLFPNFINATTNQLLAGHYFQKTVNGQTISVLNVEPLTTRLRAYFNCSTLEGAYMENEGGTGSVNSHFERRIFYNEYMTASTLQDVRISQFTLALLEGSGWYKPDYTKAEAITWGQNKGCSFLDSPCVNTTTQLATSEEYCSPLKKMTCSWTGRGTGVCGTTSLKTSTTLANSYNYWGNSTIVNDAFADNCPIPDIYSNLDCEDERNQAGATLPTQEFYGYGGKCFIGNLYPVGKTVSTYGYCFKQSCDLQADGTYLLRVFVGNVTVTCTNTNQISVTGFSGKLNCPDPNVFCNRQNSEGFCRKSCAARGTCVNQKCQCVDGWGNYDCTRKVYTHNCTACTAAGQDPFKSTCYGDSCVCNPSNSTCMTATTTTTTTIGTKMEEDFNFGERIGDGASSDTITVNKVEQPSSSRPNIGIIIGAAIGGIVVLLVGLYCGVKVTKNYKKNKATRAPSLKKANSIANPTLQKQMTDNQAKYAVVP